MIIRKIPEEHIILLLIFLYLQAFRTYAGATSTQKNIVNLYTNSPSDNSSATNPNQFQNEYQYHQSASKLAAPDRYKTTTASYSDGLALDQTLTDVNSPSSSEFSYQNSRVMTNVPDCKGRLKLNGTRGYITDGPGYYQTNLQCIWLIDSGRDNATIRIQVHQFNTECNYDFLYIFDGNSIYSPLVAALSGDMKDFSSAVADSRLENMISNQDNKQTNYNSNYTTNQATQTDGAIVPSVASESRSFELKTESGKAFIYFHSDTAQSMSGFYLTYSVDACPLDCSNRGECDYISLKCKCNNGYYGDGCQHLLCPNNCTSPTHGKCDEEKSCICNQGFYGLDCSRSNEIQVWMSQLKRASNVPARAFHQSIVVNEIMWVIGGKTQEFSNTNTGIFKQKKTQIISSFDIAAKNWTNFKLIGITGIDHLAELSGHSLAAHGDKVFIYGGLAMNNSVLDALTVFDTKTGSLDTLVGQKRPKLFEEQIEAPVASVGHSAIVVDGDMYVFLGYNPRYGYLDFVQKFNIANNTWSIVERRGSSISGCIGHSGAFDPVQRIVYIYGGHNANRSNKLYSFDPQTESWKYLQPGPSPRYYHSSAIIDRQLIIFGGNSYNTSHQGDQCFHQTYLTYDLDCNSDELISNSSSTDDTPDCVRKCWKSIDDGEPGILKRHGHSIVTRDREVILFGGFNGIFMNDVRFMDIGTCDMIHQASECKRSKLAIDCQWDDIGSKCYSNKNRSSLVDSSERADISCSKNLINSIQKACENRETCLDCLSTSLGCVWCGYLSQCQYSKCKSLISKAITSVEYCYRDEFPMDGMRNISIDSIKNLPMHETDLDLDCKLIENCYLCRSKPHCSWQNDICTYNSPSVISSPAIPPTSLDDANEVYSNNPLNLKSLVASSNTTKLMQKLDPINRSLLAALINPPPYSTCDTPCYMRRSCNECATTKCIWCSTTEQCIDSSSYFAYHAVGQCMHYVAHSLKCPIAACSDISTCDKCLTNPKCGWLNEISNTGKGRCIEGDNNGPIFDNFMSPDVGSNSTSSPLLLTNWHFTSCPSCQCNGHSYCKPNTSFCIQSCQDNTEGPHCDRCIQGYFGDPVNGGVCRPCRCNGHAQTCNRESGKCYCSTKGIIGHNCNRCDEKNYYLGDPSSPGNGTCYYNLTTDYQYTFNMSKPEDHFYSDINFINVPLRKDSDVDFTIACSRLALVNITAGISYKNRKSIHTSLECGSFRLRFPHDRLVFTDANYSFFVHVYKFQTPFILQIAFSQHRTLYLPQFFFTFSSCFLFFFALSGLVWKLKHEYDLYVRRQRQFIEMEQMASRPFSTVLLEVFKPSSSSKNSNGVRLPTAEPTPVSFEPCFSSNVGVLSLFVQLPGRPNLAIGSALVTLNDDSNGTTEDEGTNKRSDKDYTAVKNM